MLTTDSHSGVQHRPSVQEGSLVVACERKEWAGERLLEQYGWQPGAGGIVIQTSAHQRHGLNNAETILQAPPQQNAVARRDKNPRAGKGLYRSKECLHVQIRLRRRVAKEGEMGRVSRDAAASFDHARDAT
jgi:hypothetical protein